MIGYGVLGLGEFGRYSLEAYKELADLKLVGTFDHNLPDQSTFDSYESLLANAEIQIVIINTPNHLHYEQVKQALEAGKNVHCEKPLTLSLAEAAELFELAESKHLRLTCNHPLIHSDLYQYLKELVDSKKFGGVKKISVVNNATESKIQTAWYWDKQKSGGWFFTSEYHFIDLFNYLLGQGEVLEANEAVVGNRTISTLTILDYQGVSASIDHRLDTPEDKVDCIFTLEFEKSIVKVFGWVPEILEVRVDNQLAETKKITSRDRDQEYKRMLNKSLNEQVSQDPLVSKEQILSTIKLCETATKKAGLDT